ncbi:MAG: thioredoxin [Clostridia bacterium]|nr:thioredoxin [Clostridia bacterium]
MVARVFVAVAGLVLLVVGICGDGMQEVLTKAINICTQCIGLG